MKLLQPSSTYIAPDVNPGRIASDVIIYPGCRLSGADLSIGPGSTIGEEAPATVNNCQLGANVHLAGGFFERTTFLDGFKAGSGAHVRQGCLFEEASSIAHSVGAKQTVFMPWVTAGSLINFCDILMAGGTSRKNHSEIGSSYIHFNFTPKHDKATASLIGDVPRGVLLNNDRIFLGGQGGIVGPCQLAFGTVIPAGQIWRPSSSSPVPSPPSPVQTRAQRIQRIVRANLTYIGNILALDAWYRVIREPFMSGDPFQRACYQGALQRISEMLKERLFRLDEFAMREKLSPPMTDALAQTVADRETARAPRDVLAIAEQLPKMNYLQAIQSIPDGDAHILTRWLNGHVGRASRNE